MAGSRALLVVLVVAVMLAASSSVGFGADDDVDDVEDVGRRSYPPLARGLSFGFYRRSCPQAERIVRRSLRSAARRNPGLIPALIRIHFHDCFIQGCDGSVLLDNSTGGVVSERTYPPNLTLRPAAFSAINSIGRRLRRACGRVVSCADIVALTARDSVRLVQLFSFFFNSFIPRPAGRRRSSSAHHGSNEAILILCIRCSIRLAALLTGSPWDAATACGRRRRPS
jgi:peroxidase